MKICIAVLFSLTISSFALAETLCGLVRVMRGPSVAAVEPIYTIEMQDSLDGVKQVIRLMDDGILRELKNGVNYCLTGDYYNWPNGERSFVVGEIREI